MRKPSTGRGWAYTSAILGGLVSVVANIAHSFVPPANATTGWRPEIGAVIGAMMWPVLLFLAIETLARTPWPHGLNWHLVRWLGLLPVALVAAFVSYRHLSGLLAHYGEEPLVVRLGPLAVDGLMAMATGALIATGRHHQPNPADSTPATTPANPSGTNTPVAATVTNRPTNPTGAPALVVEADRVSVPAHLVSTARFAVTNHESVTGRPITAPELAARMSIPIDTAGQLLTLVERPEPAPANPTRINGAHVADTQ